MMNPLLSFIQQNNSMFQDQQKTFALKQNKLLCQVYLKKILNLIDFELNKNNDVRLCVDMIPFELLPILKEQIEVIKNFNIKVNILQETLINGNQMQRATILEVQKIVQPAFSLINHQDINPHLAQAFNPYAIRPDPFPVNHQPMNFDVPSQVFAPDNTPAIQHNQDEIMKYYDPILEVINHDFKIKFKSSTRVVIDNIPARLVDGLVNRLQDNNPSWEIELGARSFRQDLPVTYIQVVNRSH